MFDLGWTELLLIGIVALIVVGPKDLPGMFRTLGRFTGKMRNMAREFSRAMNEAADEAGVKDVKDMASGLRDATSPSRMGLNRLNEAADKFEAWDPSATATKKPPQTAQEAAGLPEDRAEAARKIREYSTAKGNERAAAAKAEAAAKASDGTVAAKPARPAAKSARPATARTKPAAAKAPAEKAKSAKAPKATRPAAKPAKPAAKPAKPRAATPKPPAGDKSE